VGHLARAEKSIPVWKTVSISFWFFPIIFSSCSEVETFWSQDQGTPIFSFDVEDDGDGLTSRSAFATLHKCAIYVVRVQAL